MSKPIEPGCWAYIARGLPCCGRGKALPLPFIVTSIVPCRADSECSFCGHLFKAGRMLAAGYHGDPKTFVMLSRLERLDDLPPESSTETDHREPATA